VKPKKDCQNKNHIMDIYFQTIFK